MIDLIDEIANQIQSVLHVCGDDPIPINIARDPEMCSPRMWR